MQRVYLLFRDITLNEALDLLEDVNDACDLYIEPPDVAELTDENSRDEENFTMANLTWNQLRSSAETQFRTQRDESFVKRAETSNQSSSPTAGPYRKKKCPTTSDFLWNPNQGSPKDPPIFSEPYYSRYRDFSPREMFELFFDETLFDLIVEQSNIHCQSKNIIAPAVTKEEINFFFQF